MNRSTAMEVAREAGMTAEEFARARHDIARRVYHAGQQYRQVTARATAEMEAARRELVDVFAEASRMGMGCDLIAKCTAEPDLLRDSGLKAKQDRPTGRPVVTFATVHRWLRAPREGERR